MTTAIAHPNIALCKYWGKLDLERNLPATASLSLTLAPFATRTTVEWGAETDEAWLGGSRVDGTKVFRVLDRLVPGRAPAHVWSENNFPTSAGLASSASGFAALVMAAAPERSLDELASFARLGSGSATRSLHGGWVEWAQAGERGVPVAPAEHWDVRMVVAVLASGPKATPSTEGMLHTAATSPYYPAWVEHAQDDVEEARAAVLSRELERLGRVMERSSMRMHASMLAADPPLCYWRPGSIDAMDVVRGLRAGGLSAWYTMDAGPNVKVLCAAADAETVAGALRQVCERVEVLHPGGSARVV